MVENRAGFHSMVAMALCALLSLLAFLGLLILTAFKGGVLTYLGLAAALACPAIWLAVLQSDHRGSALAAWLKRVRERV